MAKIHIYFGTLSALDKILEVLDSNNIAYEVDHGYVELDENDDIKDADGTITISTSLAKYAAIKASIRKAAKA